MLSVKIINIYYEIRSEILMGEFGLASGSNRDYKQTMFV